MFLSIQNNIVQLKHYCIENNEPPELYFEYLPLGDLSQYTAAATTFHKEQVIFQVLSAVDFIHNRLEPVVHRDIKPENVFVQEWETDIVHVKLGDFGLSNRGELLKTFCGTPLYLAPEGYTNQTNIKYGPLVDVWSVGVLALVLEAGEIPEYLDSYKTNSMAWAEVVIGFARDWYRRRDRTDLLAFALEYMLVADHKKRKDASQSLERAQRLPHVMGDDEVASLVDMESPGGHSEESGPPTPKALPTLNLDEGGSSEASTIHESLLQTLATGGDEVIDGFIGLAPSDEEEFENSAAVTPKAECDSNGMPAFSILEGSLWNGSFGEEGFVGTVEGGVVVESVEGVEEEKAEEWCGEAGEVSGKEDTSTFILMQALLAATTSGENEAVVPKSPSYQVKKRFRDEKEDETGDEKEIETEDEQQAIVMDGADIFGHRAARRKRTRLGNQGNRSRSITS